MTCAAFEDVVVAGVVRGAVPELGQHAGCSVGIKVPKQSTRKNACAKYIWPALRDKRTSLNVSNVIYTTSIVRSESFWNIKKNTFSTCQSKRQHVQHVRMCVLCDVRLFMSH